MKFIIRKAKPLEKSYTGPRNVAEVTLAAWTQFFHEGGQLNVPPWLETNRLSNLKKQFSLLANLHRGSK